MDQAITPEQTFPVAPAPYVTIYFDDQRRSFRRMVFRGALLELITLGFYRFWLATNIRRHIWRSISAGGDALEYTGTGKELLLGALLALGIFAPVYLVYFLVTLEAERMQAFAGVPFFLFFYLFSQFAVFRARRYRMTRTIWRGVRFWMTGSGWNYAWRSALLMLVVVLTLGLFLPWREAILERFKMRHSHYGDLQGSFAGTGWEFFKRGWGLWLIAIAVVVLPSLLASRAPGSAIFAQVLLVTIGGPFFYGAFKAIQWRWWISGIRFGGVSFASDVLAQDLFGLYWKVVGWLLLLLIVLSAAITGIVFAGGLLAPGTGTLDQKIMIASQQWHVLIPMFLCYVIAALMATAVMRLYLIHDMAARVAVASYVIDLASAQDVAARGAAANAIGEGLADSLEIFGF